MNLRDQLLKAGLVKKTDVVQAERDLRKQAKVDQGNRERKALLDQKAAAEAEQRRKEAEEALVARRREARERDVAEMAMLRPRQILRSHRISFRPGPQRFWYRSPRPPEIWRLDLPERLAEDLRRGLLAIAWVDDQNPSVVVVDAATAAQVEAIRPGLVLFWNREHPGKDPAEQLYAG